MSSTAEPQQPPIDGLKLVTVNKRLRSRSYGQGKYTLKKQCQVPATSVKPKREPAKRVKKEVKSKTLAQPPPKATTPAAFHNVQMSKECKEIKLVDFAPAAIDAIVACSGALAVYRSEEQRLEFAPVALDWNVCSWACARVDCMVWLEGPQDAARALNFDVFERQTFSRRRIMPRVNVPTKTSGQSAAFMDSRLFTGNATGIQQWNPCTGLVERDLSIDSPAIAITITKQANQSLLLVAHMDGNIRRYRVGVEGLVSEGLFAFCEHPISALVATPDGRLWAALVGVGAVQVWDLSTRQSLGLLYLPERKTSVTCLAASKNAPSPASIRVFVGDARGHLTVWSSEMLCLLQDIKTHEASVLAVCLPQDGQVYCSGVDYKTVQLVQGDASWVVAVQHRFHTHDVRAMASVKLGPTTDSGCLLVSGGVDGNVMLCDTRFFIRGPSILSDRRISDAPNAVRLLAKRLNASLAVVLAASRQRFDILRVSGPQASPSSAAQINTGRVRDWMVYGGDRIVACMADGRLKVFSLTPHGDEVGVQVSISENVKNAVRVAACPGNTVAVSTSQQQLLIVDLQTLAIESLAEARVGNLFFGSETAGFAFTKPENPSIVVFGGKELRFMDPLVVACLDSTGQYIAAIDNRNSIVIASVLTGSSRGIPLDGLRNRRDRWHGISFDDQGILKLASSETIVKACLSTESLEPGRSLKLAARPRFSTCCGVTLFWDGDIIIRKDWNSIVDALPPAFHRRQYGAS